jgi:hypothetical protein
VWVGRRGGGGDGGLDVSALPCATSFRARALSATREAPALCSTHPSHRAAGQVVLTRWLDAQGAPCPDALRLGFLNAAFQTGVRSLLDDAILQSGGVVHLSVCMCLVWEVEARVGVPLSCKGLLSLGAWA